MFTCQEGFQGIYHQSISEAWYIVHKLNNHLFTCLTCWFFAYCGTHISRRSSSHPSWQYLSEEAWSINDHPQTAPSTDPNAPKFQLKEQQEEQYTNSPAHKPTRTICKSKHMIELNNTINTQLKNQKLGIGNGHHKHQPSLQEKGLNSNNTHFSKPNSYTKPSILTKQYHHVTHFLSLQHNSMNNYGGFPQLIMLKSSYSESWNSLSLVARHCSNNQRAMMFNPDVCPTLTRNVDCPSLWSRGPSYPIHRILTN